MKGPLILGCAENVFPRPQSDYCLLAGSDPARLDSILQLGPGFYPLYPVKRPGVESIENFIGFKLLLFWDPCSRREWASNRAHSAFGRQHCS